MANPLVNGLRYGWSHITVNLFGRNIQGITAVMYSEEQEKENLYGAGTQPVARGLGAEKTEASIKLGIEEVLALQNLTPRKRLQDIPPFDVIVQYRTKASPVIVTDVIKNCEFMGNKRDTKQGDKGFDVELKLLPSHIEWSK